MNKLDSKLCVALGNCSFDECLAIMARVSLVELRLDLLSVHEKLETLIKQPTQTVVTFRPTANESLEAQNHRMAVLKKACALGATFIDIEIEASESYRAELIAAAKLSKTKIIISYHNFACTPCSEELKSIVAKCFAMGADIAKVACQVNARADNLRLLALLEDPRTMIVAGMGELGKTTRITAPLLGSALTYVTPPGRTGTALGQLSYDEMLVIYKQLVACGVKLEVES